MRRNLKTLNEAHRRKKKLVDKGKVVTPVFMFFHIFSFCLFPTSKNSKLNEGDKKKKWRKFITDNYLLHLEPTEKIIYLD